VAAVEHVASADGTRIAYRSWGSGDPIVFVHGSATSGADWLLVLPLLRDRFTIVVMDRRGRGESGDGPDYAMEREAEDILAVLEATGSEMLVGHSYGAMCSIKAAERTDRLLRLVIYEPPIAIGEQGLRPLDELIASGDRAAALETFLRSAGARREQLDAIRSSPAWPTLLTAVPALSRELHAAAGWRHPRDPIDIPTLWVQGADTKSPTYLEGLDDLQGAFPALRLKLIPDQSHFAHVFAAEQFATLVRDFCGDPDDPAHTRAS
jgi:pimeloyl-ACP methyl ester carboxylesterase